MNKLADFLQFTSELFRDNDYYKKMPYHKYLHTYHWEQLRKIKLDEVEYRCQVCYSPTKLQVHHRTYERLGYEKLTDLTVLCAKCHTLFHDKLALTKPPKRDKIKVHKKTKG